MHTIRTKTAVCFSLLALLNVGAALILLHSVATQDADSVVINLAGAQRMLSQRMTKEALILGAGGDPAPLKASRDQFDRVLRGLSAGDEGLGLPGTTDPALVAKLGAVNETWRTFRADVEAVIANPGDRERLKPLLANNVTLLKQSDVVVKAFERNARAKVSATSHTQIVITGVLLALMIAAWFGVQRGLLAPLAMAVQHLETAAAGDLAHELPERYRQRRDEIGQFARALHEMSTRVREVLRRITESVGALATSAAELHDVSSTVSVGSEQVCSKASSVASAAEELNANFACVSSGVEQSSQSLKSVVFSTEQMTATIGEIARSSERARVVTEAANRQTSDIKTRMDALGASTEQIGQITETIAHISAQTQLLALNAAIEAARAGAGGRGFAVVANEIKDLAQKSAAATVDIRQMIEGVQTSMGSGVAGVEKVAGVVAEVRELVASIAAAIEEQLTVTGGIGSSIGEAANGMNDASARVVESTLASSAIADDIAQVDSAMRHVAESSAQALANAAALKDIASVLRASVAQFQV